MRFDIITIFPKIFDSYFNESLIKRALLKKIIQIKIWNLRIFAKDKRKTVDDKPFGGGPGMVLKLEPIYKAINFIKNKNKNKKQRIILFSPQGKQLNLKVLKKLLKYEQLILICGRYEGVDERVAKYLVDEKISIGPYILSGGELAAMVFIESLSRLIPGFLGKSESLEYSRGSYPVYTRPAVFLDKKNKNKKWIVPKVLLSGNHKEIEKWRKKYLKKYE
ncbi:MAG: tRNA (guanosine(37)-N1)-methyltransferase TrmD [Patescibacteria group bacterium]|nr:tRNA (guanosine(37)-N1)-methyltransferase TrmD [Patescibacteria group bacterium]MDW8279746.1 tRNA (guanosine(37)-N1)-methyltransferase TrmD [bacterium]